MPHLWVEGSGKDAVHVRGEHEGVIPGGIVPQRGLLRRFLRAFVTRDIIFNRTAGRVPAVFYVEKSISRKVRKERKGEKRKKESEVRTQESEYIHEDYDVRTAFLFWCFAV